SGRRFLAGEGTSYSLRGIRRNLTLAVSHQKKQSISYKKNQWAGYSRFSNELTPA
ncbi:hypothetical protein HN873_071093, partial [Arachis hypogaea]